MIILLLFILSSSCLFKAHTSFEIGSRICRLQERIEQQQIGMQ